jgi:cellulose synthase/poly-beta-1,6-N-acetylglucosamine synthase-like glycosyltransferase
MSMLTASVGVMASNEEQNIGKLLTALKGQSLENVEIRQIIVVSSGSTDGTDDIVAECAAKDDRISLIRQEQRMGKASAINLFLDAAEADIFVLESGDTIPAPDCVECMLAPFQNPDVGMTGGRPVPVDDPNTFMGFVVHMLWRLHHMLALKSPKLGEMVAFRSFVRSIPPDTAVDEASIEALVIDEGLSLAYADDAIVYNKGAATVGDFLKQRRRIYAGHIWLSKVQSYEVSTKKVGGILSVLLEDLKPTPRTLLWTAGGVFLEFVGRLLGAIDYHVLKKNPYTWEVSHSTKNLDAPVTHDSGARGAGALDG